MQAPYTQFIFESYAWDATTGTATFHYSYDRTLRFVETLVVDVTYGNITIPDQLLFALHLALGVSYWKAYCPKEIRVESGVLTKEQATFWNTLYTKGLGEFFYQNQIDFRGLVQFPFEENHTVVATASDVSLQDGVLIPIGGGKDSLVTIELFKKAGIDFATYTLNRYDVIEKQREQLPQPHYTITRTMDPQLFEVNSQGAYNGHVPISSIYAFTAVLQAIVMGARSIVLSNERSANSGNVHYLGEEINHQWTKSFAFEQMIHRYIQEYIHPEIEYYSVLRPLYDIAIAREFATVPEWFSLFSSCNRNFALQKTFPSERKWCGECPKCAFVFAILTPFIEKQILVEEIFGKNLFADTALQPLYAELLGIAEIKPFDCVGIPEEVIVAFALSNEKGEYKNDAIMQYVVAEVLPEKAAIEEMQQEVFSRSSTHLIPEHYLYIINDFT